MILYHLDRTDSLKEGQIIDLERCTGKIPDYALTSIEKLFADGFSYWGFDHFKDSQLYNELTSKLFPLDLTSFSNIMFNLNNQIIELFYELIRREFFKTMPSRYQSVFAFENLKTIKEWPELMPNSLYPKATVWEIETVNEAIKLDSRCLKGGLCFPYDSQKEKPITFSSAFLFDFAFNYWSQNYSENPRFEFLVKPPVKVVKKINTITSDIYLDISEKT